MGTNGTTAAGQISAGGGYGTIIGGAGADSITFSGAATAGGFAGVIGFSSLSDSTESKMDIITFSAGASAGVFNLNLAMSDAIAGNTTNATQRISAGVLQSAGANTTFSQVLSAANALNTTTGRSLLFAHSGDAYVFVQGGSTDLVAKFEAGVLHSAQDLAITAVASGQFGIKLSTDLVIILQVETKPSPSYEGLFFVQIRRLWPCPQSSIHFRRRNVLLLDGWHG